MLSPYWRLVKFGFRLLYNEMAFTYDLVSGAISLGEWRSWQRAAIKHLNAQPGACILEIAHGTGNLQIDLHAAGFDSIGCDLSRTMGEIALGKLTRHGIRPKLVRIRAQALPFANASFPAVVSTFPTEFIVDPETIAEVYRILKPGGRFVFVPSGQLTGGGLARQGIDAAYRATGQGGSWPIRVDERFTAAGFHLSQAFEACRISVAHVIIAEK